MRLEKNKILTLSNRLSWYQKQISVEKMQIVVTKLQDFDNITLRFVSGAYSLVCSVPLVTFVFFACLISPVSVVAVISRQLFYLIVSVSCRLSVPRYFKIPFHDSAYHVSTVSFCFKSLLHQFIDRAKLACVQLLVFAISTSSVVSFVVRSITG